MRKKTLFFIMLYVSISVLLICIKSVFSLVSSSTALFYVGLFMLLLGDVLFVANYCNVSEKSSNILIFAAMDCFLASVFLIDLNIISSILLILFTVIDIVILSEVSTLFHTYKN